MDRSLIQTERSRSAFPVGIGTTMKKPTTPPCNGTVVTVLHWRNSRMDAGGHGMRAISDSRVPGSGLAAQFARRTSPVAVPMQLVCTRQTMPAADVTRNRPYQRPFVNHAPTTHAPRS
jgi:hypothetical protein